MSMKPIICADVIARIEAAIVIVERLGSVRGLAFPGGKQEPGETLSQTAERECFEETGMCFRHEAVLGTYAVIDRDPRGWYVSTVFVGTAEGEIQEEAGKTRVHLLAWDDIFRRRGEFVFDHFEILEQYWSLQE